MTHREVETGLEKCSRQCVARSRPVTTPRLAAITWRTQPSTVDQNRTHKI
eukprot:CAMPEP_0170192886 /NCGR_PEP_ID=MMETSP0040_2-20121228/55497_1 /TAXON_ID=641309 /ORGANISM="Lotharella oceanica, Strain CCMP622" /LENGTH=49 /DNA_ID= /DNA_START= /DNA_END= /DNA_ORIENTATION=